MSQIIDGLKVARDAIAPDLTVQRLLVLMTVAENEGLSQGELGQLMTRISTTALSRNLADLSAISSRKAPGPALIRQRPDPDNLRRRQITLTPKGRRLVSRIKGAFGER
ncbi:MAG: hypothetical protein AAGJ86_09865 [Pseudomonadota bacterium]